MLQNPNTCCLFDFHGRSVDVCVASLSDVRFILQCTAACLPSWFICRAVYPSHWNLLTMGIFQLAIMSSSFLCEHVLVSFPTSLSDVSTTVVLRYLYYLQVTINLGCIASHFSNSAV